MRLVPGAALVTALTLAACHVTTRTEVTHTRASRPDPRLDQPRALPPALAIADGGVFFVEPLVCPSDDVVEVEPELQTKREPNLATFVVGVVATVVGGVALVTAIDDDDRAGNPVTYGGAGLVAIGLPLAIGPWLGNDVESEPRPARTDRRPGKEVACGSRPLAGGVALLELDGRKVYGAVDDAGRFAVSPFSWIDAFDPAGSPAVGVRAELRDRAGQNPRAMERVIDRGTFADDRAAFLAGTRLDVTVEPLRAMPRVTAGAIRLGQVLVGNQAMLHVQFPLANAGPGDAWQVRAVLVSKEPELEGRVVYLGHVAPKSTVTGEAWIPLSPSADSAIRAADVELGFRLLDAHQTMPADRITYRGPVHDDGFQ
jgi:hypothetical protein